MSAFWLSKKRKPELVDLCQRLGIQTDGYLKSDLEGMLVEYLDTHESQLSHDDVFSGYYDAQARSPQKNPAFIGLNPPVELTTLPEKRLRRKGNRSAFASSSSFGSPSSGAETTPEPQINGFVDTMERRTRSASRALAPRTPRTRQLRDEAAAAGIPIPPSPAVVATSIEHHTNAFIKSAKQTVERTEIQEKALSLRDRFSNVTSVNAVALALEAVLLLTSIIPISYIVTVPPIDALGIEKETSFVLPDLFIFLTTAFWSPFLTWAFTSIALPAVNAMLFNLVATSVGASSEARENAHLDPLTFAVTKALVAYLVHYKGYTLGGLLGEKTIQYVGASVGKELQLIGAGVGGIAAVWEGILRR